MSAVQPLAADMTLDDFGGWLESTSGLWLLDEPRLPQFIQVHPGDVPRPMEHTDRERILRAYRVGA